MKKKKKDNHRLLSLFSPSKHLLPTPLFLFFFSSFSLSFFFFSFFPLSFLYSVFHFNKTSAPLHLYFFFFSFSSFYVIKMWSVSRIVNNHITMETNDPWLTMFKLIVWGFKMDKGDIDYDHFTSSIGHNFWINHIRKSCYWNQYNQSRKIKPTSIWTNPQNSLCQRTIITSLFCSIHYRSTIHSYFSDRRCNKTNIHTIRN